MHPPVPEAERPTFAGLPYYAVDPDWRFDDLSLEPYTGDEPSNFQIPTSDGQLRPAHRAGVLRFEREGGRHGLTAYTFDGGVDESLFVPFLDATSGTETYGAGRYMDVEPEEDGTYSLDFNLAYHPSCVYDPKYSCPLTPAENRLPMRIEAGLALGIHPVRVFARVILPQATKIAIPNIGSMFIGMVKDTSTFTVIGLLEVVRVTQNLNSTTFQPFVLYTAAAALYVVAAFGIDTATMFVPILVLMIMAIGLNYLIGAVERRVAPWQAEIAGRDE